MDFFISARDATAGELPPDQVFASKLTGIIALKKMMQMGIQIRFSCFGDGESKNNDSDCVCWGVCSSVRYLLVSFSTSGLNHLRPFASEDRGARSRIRFFAGM